MLGATLPCSEQCYHARSNPSMLQEQPYHDTRAILACCPQLSSCPELSHEGQERLLDGDEGRERGHGRRPLLLAINESEGSAALSVHSLSPPHPPPAAV